MSRGALDALWAFALLVGGVLLMVAGLCLVLMLGPVLGALKAKVGRLLLERPGDAHVIPILHTVFRRRKGDDPTAAVEDECLTAWYENRPEDACESCRLRIELLLSGSA